MSSIRRFFKCIFLLCLVNVAWGFSIIKIKSSSRAVAKASSDNFIELGDIFLLERGTSKCLVTALREKNGHFLISTEECNFKARAGDQLTYMSFEKRGGRRKVASSGRNSGNKARGLESRSKFYVGGLLVHNPEVEYDELKLKLDNKEINTDADGSTKYESLYSIFFGYSKFYRKLFYDVGLDIPLVKAEEEGNDGASIRPISLIGNLGFFHPVREEIYLKYFLGVGVNSHEFRAESMKIDSGAGDLFQLGVGVVYQNITFDIIFRLIKGSVDGELRSSYVGLEKNVPFEFDYSMSDICFKAGFLF